MIIGAECLVLEKAVLAGEEEAPVANAMAQVAAPAKKEISPAEWAPWSFMSAGAVVLLYSFTIPRRVGG